MVLLSASCGVAPVISSSTDSIEVNSENPLVMPLEVFSTSTNAKRLRLELPAAPFPSTRMVLRAHRIGYRHTREGAPLGSAKASLRINGDSWQALTDSTISLDEQSRAYGGIAGGFYSSRFTVEVPQLSVTQTNDIVLRFNGTDGETMGFRVLTLNFLDDAGAEIYSDELFREVLPSEWLPPEGADADRGRARWTNAQLIESPLNPTLIRARCADCHDASGRDLEYFAYSNRSIIARAKFHGLSHQDGEDIAAYIRSHPAPRLGRPWNPPYQPGPAHRDDAPDAWAAGQGLDSVLSDDLDMLGYVFPQGLKKSALRDVLRFDGHLNVRRLPIAIQLPDWNAWLPSVHPKDAWADGFIGGPSHPAQRYEDLRRALAESLEELIENDELLTTIGAFHRDVRTWVGEGQRMTSNGGNSAWRTIEGRNIGAALNTIPVESAKLSLSKWIAVKTWEQIQLHDLEKRAPELRSEGGERLAWPSDAYSVFQIAPHIVSDTTKHFNGQSKVAGLYASSAWYQLQMTLNAGQKQWVRGQPMDWAYHLSHLYQLDHESDRMEPTRLMTSLLKLYQTRNNGAGPTDHGWRMRVTNPFWLWSDYRNRTTVWDRLNARQLSLRTRVLDVMLKEHADLLDTFELDSWSRCDASSPNRWFCVDPPPTAGDSSTYPTNETTGKIFFPTEHRDNLYRLAHQTVITPSPGRRSLLSWCERMWPFPASKTSDIPTWDDLK